MHDKLSIIPANLLGLFNRKIDFDPLQALTIKSKEELPVDYFQFYNSISTVYSSKIEGENIDYDSYFKYKFLNIKYQPDYTKRADDLYEAYLFILTNKLTEKNVLHAHDILSKNLLPASERGKLRTNPMFVINEVDRIEYVAAEPHLVNKEWLRFFNDIDLLLSNDLTVNEVFYFAAMIHLVFVKIHPFQDGNGRTARLLEKWFLLEKLGEKAVSVELEKNYYVNRVDYYNNIRKLGLTYEELDYEKALDFALMTISSIQ